MDFKYIPIWERVLGIIAVLTVVLSGKYADVEYLKWIYPVCTLIMFVLVVAYVKRRKNQKKEHLF